MKIIVIDPRIAGISGDMLLAALIDLYDNEEKIKNIANIIQETLPYCERLKIKIYNQIKSGIRAKRIELEIKEKIDGIDAEEIKEYLLKIGENISLSSKAMEFTLKTIGEIIDAERRVHGEERIHLHELASADTFLDIIGTTSILDEIGFFRGEIKAYTTPPALGGGYIKMEHGLIAGPAPATLEILAKHKFKCSSTPIEQELTTPTGAALLVTITDKIIEFYPPMKISGVGYGAGSKELQGIPNVLRVVEGEEIKSIKEEEIVILETNLDDITGEVAGHLIEKLIENGALDVTITPSIGKKNRPVYIVKVLAKTEKYMENLLDLLRETGTLGVRIMRTPRITVRREVKKYIVNLMGKEYNVRVKLSYLENGEILNIKPEYEDARIIADELKIPLRNVIKEINTQLATKILMLRK